MLDTTQKINSSKINLYRVNSRGFTLIELLIVIVIISIVSAVAALTITHNKKKELEYFANDLSRTIILAQQEAMLRPATLGIGFSERNIAFFEYHPYHPYHPKTIAKPPLREFNWQILNEPNLHSKKIPENIAISVIIENKKMRLNNLSTTPAIIISTSGDITPFVILLGEKEQPPQIKIIAEENGEIKIK